MIHSIYLYSRVQFSLVAQEYGNKTLLDCYSTEIVSHNIRTDLELCDKVYIMQGSSQLRLQQFADVGVGMLSFSYIIQENISTVWPGMTYRIGHNFRGI